MCLSGEALNFVLFFHVGCNLRSSIDTKVPFTSRLSMRFFFREFCLAIARKKLICCGFYEEHSSRCIAARKNSDGGSDTFGQEYVRITVTRFSNYSSFCLKIRHNFLHFL